MQNNDNDNKRESRSKDNREYAPVYRLDAESNESIIRETQLTVYESDDNKESRNA